MSLLKQLNNKHIRLSKIKYSCNRDINELNQIFFDFNGSQTSFDVNKYLI